MSENTEETPGVAATAESEAVTEKRGRGRPRRDEAETDVVRRVRDALGMTQQEFAAELKCSLTAVRYMERGKRLPGQKAILDNFKALARRANIEVK